METAKKALGGRGHFERMRGTSEQARDYCKKCCDSYKTAGHRCEETRLAGPWEIGKYRFIDKKNGARNDLLGAKDRIDEGAHLWNLAKEDTYFPVVMRHAKALATYERARTKPRDHETIAVVHWGESGCGKTTFARQYGDMYHVHAGNNGLWWDGYEPNLHSTVLFDEMSGATMPINMFKKLIDRSPLMVETKGGVCEMTAEWAIFTSNDEPSQWWTKNIGIHWEAIKRRLKHVFHYRQRHDYECQDCKSIPVQITKLEGEWDVHPISQPKFGGMPTEDQVLICVRCTFEFKDEKRVPKWV